MKYFFTSDTHFYHTNIIKYCNRPFADAVEMTNKLIDNWNSKIQPGDMVYHLGDFTFGQDSMVVTSLLSRLQGDIILIKGNHDKLAWANRGRFFAFHDSYHETTINGQRITMCHYAMKVWNKSHYGSWHLYGHSHGTLPDDPTSRSFDVGVDCHNYFPLSFEEVEAIMNKKTFKALDHHGSTAS